MSQEVVCQTASNSNCFRSAPITCQPFPLISALWTDGPEAHYALLKNIIFWNYMYVAPRTSWTTSVVWYTYRYLMSCLKLMGNSMNEWSDFLKATHIQFTEDWRWTYWGVRRAPFWGSAEMTPKFQLSDTLMWQHQSDTPSSVKPTLT